MTNITVDANVITGKIRPMHAVCNVPWRSCAEEIEKDYMKYYKDAGIPYCRFHDMGGRFGGCVYVDIPNIFRDFNADENDPANYDFTFTDWLINRCAEYGVKIFYRLGITIENDNFLKHYRTDPPADFGKWARICEHVIAHYNEGWANGFERNIIYWEIWNEPEVRGDLPKSGDEQMWNGSDEEYFRLYETAATHLKKRFPYIMVGGYSSIGLYEVVRIGVSIDQNVDHAPSKLFNFFHNFLKYLTKDGKRVPLDFFSWHSYASDPKQNAVMSEYIKNQLVRYGYPDCENVNSEWNPGTANRGLLTDCSNIAANMLSFQKSMLDMAIYYALGISSSYNGLFHPFTCKPLKAYYVFKAFNELYLLENELRSDCDDENVYIGAAGKDGEIGLMAANRTDEDKEITVVIKDRAVTAARVKRIDEDHSFEGSPVEYSDGVTIKLPARAVYYFAFENGDVGSGKLCV